VEGNKVAGTVLIVDDEAFFLHSLTEGLSTALPGCTIHQATNGQAALDVFERHPVDLLITDLKMPRMDGLALLAELINRRIHVHTIVLSAFSSAENSARAERLGAVAVLDKPVDFEEIVRVARQALHGRRGGFEGVTLAGLLQLIEIERKSCTINVRFGGQLARIFVGKGATLDAWYRDQRGREAFSSLIVDAEGVDLEIELSHLPAHVEPAIDASLSELLLDCVRLVDEQKRGTSTAGTSKRRTQDAFLITIEPTPAGTPPTSQPTTRAPLERDGHPITRTNMADINATLQKLKQIQGAMGAALVDYETGICLGSSGDGRLNLDLAAAGNAEVVRSKLRVMSDLKITGGIHDILITLDEQLHIIRPVPKTNLFIYLAIDKRQGNLGIARHKLQEIEGALSL